MKNNYIATDLIKSIAPKEQITIDQIKIFTDVISGLQILTTSLQKGNYGEVTADLAMLSASYSALHSRISALDSQTHRGIDGVYHTTIHSRELYIIADAKYGSARLSMTKSGRQLSNHWIDPRLDSGSSEATDTPTRLEAAIGQAPACIALEKIRTGQAVLVRLLIHISRANRVSLHLVDANGYVFRRNISFEDIADITRKR